MTEGAFEGVPAGMVHPWWTYLLRGIIAIVFGLLALFWPGLTILALVIFFGVYALVDGLLEIVGSITAARMKVRWWTLLLRGILGIAVGIIVLAWPGITALILLYLIAIWAVVSGVVQIASAFSGRWAGGMKAMLAIAGALFIIFGIFLFIFPGSGALGIIWFIGAFAVVIGVLLMVFSFDIRRLVKAAT
jgi:uncharacterized membrane protein HdeD (DUF308 family)